MPRVSFHRAGKEEQERKEEERLRKLREKPVRLAPVYGKETKRTNSYAVYAMEGSLEIGATSANGRKGVQEAKKAIRQHVPHRVKWKVYNKTKKRYVKT